MYVAVRDSKRMKGRGINLFSLTPGTYDKVRGKLLSIDAVSRVADHMPIELTCEAAF